MYSAVCLLFLAVLNSWLNVSQVSEKPHCHSLLCERMCADLIQASSLNHPSSIVHSTCDQKVLVENEVEDFMRLLLVFVTLVQKKYAHWRLIFKGRWRFFRRWSLFFCLMISNLDWRPFLQLIPLPKLLLWSHNLLWISLSQVRYTVFILSSLRKISFNMV